MRARPLEKKESLGEAEKIPSLNRRPDTLPPVLAVKHTSKKHPTCTAIQTQTDRHTPRMEIEIHVSSYRAIRLSICLPVYAYGPSSLLRR